MTRNIPDFVNEYPNLASVKFGTKVIQTSDDFFAAKERLIEDAPPIFIPDKYDNHGKWMDGWESRRRRDDGHDWCVIELGVPGHIFGAEIDTSYFTGNYPPAALIEGCPATSNPNDEGAWISILPRVELHGDQQQYFPIDQQGGPWRWVRLSIFPDGGVARLRLYGSVVPDWSGHGEEEAVELSALKSGGSIVAYNDAHYGDLWALLTEGRGKTMGDGWETRRRREPGHDWIIIALGARGSIDAIEVDTAHFKGNYPDGVSFQAADIPRQGKNSIPSDASSWGEIMPRQKLEADTVHRFTGQQISAVGPVTHVRMNIYPDGGVSRLRVFGRRIK